MSLMDYLVFFWEILKLYLVSENIMKRKKKLNKNYIYILSF